MVWETEKSKNLYGHELRGGTAGGLGGAGQRGDKGGKWGNCNSIINKIYLKKESKVLNNCSSLF